MIGDTLNKNHNGNKNNNMAKNQQPLSALP